MFDTGEVIEAGFASSAKSEREIKSIEEELKKGKIKPSYWFAGVTGRGKDLILILHYTNDTYYYDKTDNRIAHDYIKETWGGTARFEIPVDTKTGEWDINLFEVAGGDLTKEDVIKLANEKLSKYSEEVKNDLASQIFCPDMFKGFNGNIKIKDRALEIYIGREEGRNAFGLSQIIRLQDLYFFNGKISTKKEIFDDFNNISKIKNADLFCKTLNSLENFYDIENKEEMESLMEKIILREDHEIVKNKKGYINYKTGNLVYTIRNNKMFIRDLRRKEETEETNYEILDFFIAKNARKLYEIYQTEYRRYWARFTR